MNSINHSVKRTQKYPEKVLQFGEGNFLRAFADYSIDLMNKNGIFGGSVVICQPIENGLCDAINSQDGLYTLILRGKENGEAVQKTGVIESVSRCINPYEDFDELLNIAKSEDLKIIISNTTEAGIEFKNTDRLEDAPAQTYPAKLTRFLYERFIHFKGSEESKLFILPVELIDKNGTELKKCVQKYAELWELSEDFKNWIDTTKFSNTLVDRIVTGFPKKDYSELCRGLGYEDKLLDTAEPFFFWAIEQTEGLKEVFPVHKVLNGAVFCPDISGYKIRKVRILNGSHTVSVLGAYLSGFDIVRDMVNDSDFNAFLMSTLTEEIIPTIPLPQKEKEDFMNAVLVRYANPFIDHRLLDISLNSVSKYKARCLPTVVDNLKAGKFPKRLIFGLCCLMEFYNGEYKDGAFVGTREGNTYEIKDSKDVLDFFAAVKDDEDRVAKILENADFWGEVLTEYEGVLDFCNDKTAEIKKKGIKEVMRAL